MLVINTIKNIIFKFRKRVELSAFRLHIIAYNRNRNAL